MASPSSSPSSSSTKYTLKTSDNKEFTVDKSIAIQFQTIKHMIDDGCTLTAIPLPNVESHILGMVIEYCSKHADGNASEDYLKVFDSEFVKKDLPIMFQLVAASNYLNVQSLFEVVCQEIADTIKDLMPEEVRKIFNIENDFSPEEEAAIRKEHEYTFEI